jgi:pimeloyl-ACP methyl ester carboxylesterase
MPAPLREAYRAASPHPEALATFVEKTVALMRGFADVPEATLRAIAAPTLVMLGDTDVIVPEHALAMVRRLPRARLAIWPGSAHGACLGVAEAAAPGSPLPSLALTVIEAFLDER